MLHYVFKKSYGSEVETLKLNKETLLSDLKEKGIEKILEGFPPEAIDVYRRMFKIEMGDTNDSYVRLLESFIPQIREVILNVWDKTELSKNPSAKGIFLGRSPYWILKILELIKGENKHCIALPFSGTPDISMNGIIDDEQNKDNIISLVGLLNFFNLMKALGLDTEGPNYVLDHLGSGRSMISFYRIYHGFFKFIGKPAPTLTLIDMNLTPGKDKKTDFWSYNAEHSRVEFTVGKDYMFPRTQEGFDKFTLPVIPLGLDPNITSIFDFGPFEERYCSIPKYPAKAWETDYREVAKEGKFGFEGDKLKSDIKSFLQTLEY